jgi:hypothetical protein
MQPYVKSLLTATVLLLSVGSWAQEVYHFNGPDLLARLSYDSSPVVQRDGVRHVCVAVSHDGVPFKSGIGFVLQLLNCLA